MAAGPADPAAGAARAGRGLGRASGRRCSTGLIGAAAGWLALVALAWLYRRLRGREGLGGGDPKLLAGIGAWLGVLQLPFVLLGAGLVGLARGAGDAAARRAGRRRRPGCRWGR